MAYQSGSEGASRMERTHAADTSDASTPLLRSSSDRLSNMKGQVDEVKTIMKDNIEKVIDRGDKVTDLQDRTDNLVVNSNRFAKNSTDLRKQEQRRNWKMTCCIATLVIIVIAIITLIILYALKVI